MRGFLLSLSFCLIALPISAQTAHKPAVHSSVNKAPAKSATNQSRKPAAKSVDDTKEFEKASIVEDPAGKIAALKKFIAAFPESTLLNQAKELLSSTAYSAADANYASGNIAPAIDLYKLATNAAPTPISTALFNDSLSKIPNALFWHGNRAEAIDIAKTLELRIGSDSDQLSSLAMFYVGIENGDEAVRVAEAAVKADPSKSKPYGVLGLAERVNFKLDESAAAYAKALELEPNSASLRRNLAEIKRATGNADDAVALYREAVAADANDVLSQNGLVLSLFDAGKIEEAEKAMSASLEQNPNNVMLMAGAAYWYAAHKMDEKAITLARKAIAVEPRYVWSHIALGRALMLQNRPVEAEEALLRARAYGNFPTLEYEIASARAMAGFYLDAVKGLEKTFAVSDGMVVTKIGGRVERKGASFTETLADERKASILESSAADDADTAARLKELLVLHAALSASKPDENAVAKAADAFVSGDDNAKYHRQLYASSLLLNNKIAVDKALEFAEAAVGNADNALTIPNAGAYVMASELYDSRQLALSRSEFVHVPDVPKSTLAAILRGRIEDLIGWALVQENKPSDAEIHFKRALSILPEKSSWWRGSLWRYGMALQAEGKEPEALDAYIKSYSIDKPDLNRYTTVEALYKKLNGSDEGLEAKIGPSPLPGTEVIAKADTSTVPTALPVVTATPNIDQPQPTPTPIASTQGLPAALPANTETPETKTIRPRIEPAEKKAVPEAKLDPLVDQAAQKSEIAKTDVVAKIESEPKTVPEPTVDPTPTPEVKRSSTVDPTPTRSSIPVVDISPAPSPTAEMSSVVTPEQKPTIKPEESPVKTDPTPVTDPAVETVPTPTATPSPEPVATPIPTPTPEASLAPSADLPATTKPEPSPVAEQSVAKVEQLPTPSPTVTAEPTVTPTPEKTAKTESIPAATTESVATPVTEDTTQKRGKTELVVTSTIPLPTPSSTPDGNSVAQVTKKEVIKKAVQAQIPSSEKPLFEPVVITIPKSDSAKSIDRPTLEIDRSNSEGRARLVDGQPIQAIEPEPCQVSVSQEKLSLLNNGGTLSVLVGVEKGGSLADLKYVVSDPDDIVVRPEPDVSGVEGRSLYTISSKSERTGNFRVTFYLPCGKKDVTITVR